MRFEVIDNCPVPAELADEVRELKRLSGAILNSCDRSPEAEPLLRRLGKMSQRQLHDGFVRGLPGFNPANLPGRSTHERRNDGVAYAGRVGAPLRYWQVGMDWSDTPAVLRAARKRGWIATVTYPNNPREHHHVNFRRTPRVKRVRPLKRDSSGPEVRLLQARLHRLFSPIDGKRYLAGRPAGKTATFGPRTEAALERFQTEHHARADGFYGEHANAQLLVALRRQRQLDSEGLRRGGGRVGLVWLMQSRLKRAVDGQGRSYFPLRPNGRFGPKTETCVKRFQRERGLAADGIFGPKTKAKLLALLRAQRAQPPSRVAPTR